MHKQSRGRMRTLIASSALLVMAGAGWAQPAAQPAGGGATADEYAKKSDLGFQWNGDIRIREDVALYTHAEARPRFRARLRVGAKGSFAADRAFWGFGLATGTNDPVSRNVTLGGADANGTGGNVGIDLAYLGFKPLPKVSLTLGKMPDPFWVTDGVLDPDLTPEGVAVNWNIFRGTADKDPVRNVNWTTAYYFLRELPTLSADPYAVFTQLRGDVGPATLGAGLFYFGSLNAQLPGGAGTVANPWTFAANSLQTMGQVGSQLVNGRFPSDEMIVVDGRARLPFKVSGFPLILGGEVFANVKESRQYGSYEGRLDLPRLGTSGASASLTYRDSGQFSTFAPWADSDFGEGTGYHSGVRVNYTQPVFKGVNVSATYFHYDRFQPLANTTTGGGTGARTTNRFMVDVNAAF